MRAIVFPPIRGAQPMVLEALTLDPNGHFYKIMLTYLVASAGLTPVYDEVRYRDFLQDVNMALYSSPTSAVAFHLAPFVELARDRTTLPRFEAEKGLTCMLANMAYESIEKAKRDSLTGDPAFEFLRHVRHAASHGNKWHFTHGNPRHYAEWSGKAIDPARGKNSQNPFHDQECIHGANVAFGVKPAELLTLLVDVEKKL